MNLGESVREKKGHQEISVFHSTSFFHQSVPGCKEIVPALIVFTGLFPVGTQYKRKPCFCIKTRQKNNKKCRLNDTFLYGGEIGIRTLVRFTAVTRFPVVRLRPAQPSLHKSRANDGSIPHLFPLVKSYFLFFKIYLEGDSQNNF